MKKTFCSLVIVLVGFSAVVAQKATKPTTSFTISGAVKTPITVTISDIRKLEAVSIGDLVITNHLGEKRSEAHGLKGVLLRDVLSKAEITAESPRVLSEYFFVCSANDDYRIVYSWNELFNTAVGETAYIVTEKEGVEMEELPDAILMVSTKDFKTGRRHLKALTSIEVKRAR